MLFPTVKNHRCEEWPMTINLEGLMNAIDQFAKERDWNQFHTPKNLAGSICIEGSELMELFQWDSPTTEDLAADETKLAKVKEELADVLNYTLRFCSILGLDPLQIVEDKLRINGEKYPVEKAKGSAKKYTEF